MIPDQNLGPSDETSEPPAPKRKRLGQACDACRRKKIKCDSLRPACGNCSRLHRECTYNPIVRKRGPRKGYIEMLEKRLDKMEKILSRNESMSGVLQDTDLAQFSMGETSTNAHDNTMYSDNREESDDGLENPINGKTPATTVGTSVSGSTCFLSPRNGSISSDVPQLYSTSPVVPKSSVPALPPADVIDHLTQLYLENINQDAPLFPSNLLVLNLQKGRCSDFLCLCILSVAARFSTRADILEDPPWLSGEKYACKAREMIPEVIDRPSLASAQGMFLLTLHEYGCARGPRSWMYSGIAVRMALELGLNKDPVLEEVPTKVQTADKWMEQESRRRTFWMIFTIDKFMSATTGRPSILKEEDCDTLMPSNEDGWLKGHFYTESVNQKTAAVFKVQAVKHDNLFGVSTFIDTVSATNGRPSQLGFEGHLIRAVMLLDQVSVFVNHGGYAKSVRPLFSPDSDFATLDRQIDGWYNNLPQKYKLNWERAKEQPSADALLDTRSISLNILHCALIVLLHRPSLAMADGLNSDIIQPQLKSFLHGSIAKCLEAVDRVTLLMKEIRKGPKLMPPFMTYLTYTVATVIVNNLFSSKPNEIEKAKDALSEHFRFLENMRGYWAMADKLYFMIKDLYAMHKSIFQRHMRTISTAQKRPAITCDGHLVSNSPGQQEPLMNPPMWELQIPPSFDDMLNNGMRTEALGKTPVSTLDFREDQWVNQAMRNLPLADLSQTTSDGASCIDWMLGNNSQTMSSSMQSTGRFPGPGFQTLFDLGNSPSAFSPFPPDQWPLDFVNEPMNMERNPQHIP